MCIRDRIDAGAEILDVNVGVPSLDEASMLPQVVKKLQSITGLPLQIDSSNPKAIEAALRVYNGKAIVNSVNGEQEVMDNIFPIVKKYGAAVIGLTLDSDGIPNTAEKRFAIAERILNEAAKYGIPKEDVIIDCLTLTASAQQKEVNETLRAVRMVKEKLGLRTALGVSNISFGLPMRLSLIHIYIAGLAAYRDSLEKKPAAPDAEDVYKRQNLKDKGSFFFLSCLHYTLNDFHIVDIESAYGIIAFKSFLKHVLCSN